MTPEPDLLRRQRATTATMLCFRRKQFAWRAGIHCVRLAAFHLKAMGHRVPTVPRVRSALAARRELAHRGFASVSELMDSLVPRRPAPAFMRLGDVAAVAGVGGMDALFICAGPQKLIGWREDAEAMVNLDVSLDEIDTVWEV